MFPKEIIDFCKSGLFEPLDTDSNGNTLLHKSIQESNIPLAILIVDYYKSQANHPEILAAVNHQNHHGDTVLHLLARYYPESELMLTLISLGAELKVPNDDGEIVAFEGTAPEQLVGGDLQDSPVFPEWLSIEELTTSAIRPNNDLLIPF